MNSYIIRDFDETTAQISVEYENLQPFCIDLPVDENGNVPEGENLHKLIKTFLPTWHFERLNKIKNGIKNAAAIRSEIISYPQPQPLTEEEIGSIARNERNILLQQSDWTQLADNGLTVEEKQEWAVYRQLLRDLPKQTGFPININWPAKA